MFTQDDTQTQVLSASPASQPQVNQPQVDQLPVDQLTGQPVSQSTVGQPISQPVSQPAYDLPPMNQDTNDLPQADQSITGQEPVAQAPPRAFSDDAQGQVGVASTSDQFSVPPVASSVTEPSVIEPAEYVSSYTPPAEEKPIDEGVTDQTVVTGAQATPPVEINQTTSKNLDDALKELEDLMQKLQQQTPTNDQTQAPSVTPSANHTSASGDLNKIPPSGGQASSTDSLGPSGPPFTSEPDFAASQTTTPPQTTTEEVVEDQVASTQGTEQDFELPEAEETSEALIDQNIFFLLGVEDSSPEEQDHFLDELQQTVWDEFLRQDLSSKVTAEQKAEVDQIMSKASLEEVERQNEAIEYLDGIIPDFENLMMGKALKLKKDLVKERVASLRESLAQDPEKLAQLQQAEALMDQEKWLSAGQLLNQLSKTSSFIGNDYPG